MSAFDVLHHVINVYATRQLFGMVYHAVSFSG
jgi:hypothetical protein